MGKKKRTAIEPTREEDYSKWYQEVIKVADLAEHSPVRGCMVIKPWGYALWENIQRIMDTRFKELGHRNAYFPLFIPLSYMQKEATHVEGFAKECAVVTHHRLEKNADGDLVPAGPLEEPLIVRPTSEMIIGETFSRWIESYRDLPILINQWCNIVRWEMRTRLFLRTAEILWQEGHTAHATREEAQEEALQMHEVYNRFCHDQLAIPVIKGEKSESERFPGADNTYTIEAMMQDGKALQAGTSHFLGQNFSKASNISFRTASGEEEFAWTTSWGSTTRLIGALIMTHGDDDGCILPPRVAPAHIAIIPFIQSDEARSEILTYCEELQRAIRSVYYDERPILAEVDARDLRGGEKTWSAIKKGYPLRIEVGLREIKQNALSLFKRTGPHKERETLSREDLLKTLPQHLTSVQDTLYERALAFRKEHTRIISSKEEFYEYFNSKRGFVLAHWSRDPEIEEKIKGDISVTVRCVPMVEKEEAGTCIFTGKPSPSRVLFAKSY